MKTPTIIEAIDDETLFGAFLGKDHSSWSSWFAALKLLYGLPTSKEERKVIRSCTGRKKAKRLQNGQGFKEALFLTGRRSGKSRMAAVIGAFEALFAGHEKKLAKGEEGLVVVVSPTRRQSRIVHGYLRAIFNTPVLKGEVVSETRDSFTLRNGVQIETLVADPRTVRGFTLLAVVIDEVCFMGLDAESKVKSDAELVRALKPSLATVGGRLVAISSPYARKGWAYRTWKRCHGNDRGRALVWNCGSRQMNPTLPQRVVDRALEEDLAAAKAEYLGEWRDDVASFIPRDVIERLVVKDRTVLSPYVGTRYFAFADLSGGRSDDAALAIAHKDKRRVVLDLVARWKPPFDPYQVILEMVGILREYGLSKVTGDNYSAEFVRSAFVSQGIAYIKSEKPKSALFLELLPKLCAGEVELLDHEILVNQLASLERRTRAGGKDQITKPDGGHDDTANVVAGVVVEATRPRRRVGALWSSRSEPKGRSDEREVIKTRRALAALAAQQSQAGWDPSLWNRI